MLLLSRPQWEVNEFTFNVKEVISVFLHPVIHLKHPLASIFSRAMVHLKVINGCTKSCSICVPMGDMFKTSILGFLDSCQLKDRVEGMLCPRLGQCSPVPCCGMREAAALQKVWVFGGFRSSCKAFGSSCECVYLISVQVCGLPSASC